MNKKKELNQKKLEVVYKNQPEKFRKLSFKI